MSEHMFEQALKAEGVTGILADLARSIYTQESSGGKNTKTSNAGARGGMQIIQSTFDSVADKGWDINDPLQNARAGIRYVGEMFKKAGGDPALAAIGYYGGPGGIAKAKKGIAVRDPRNPNAPDTFGYAKQVVQRMGGQKGKEGKMIPMHPTYPEDGRPKGYVQAAGEAMGDQGFTDFSPAEANYNQLMEEEGAKQAQLNELRNAPDPWVAFNETLTAAGNRDKARTHNPNDGQTSTIDALSSYGDDTFDEFAEMTGEQDPYAQLGMQNIPKDFLQSTQLSKMNTQPNFKAFESWGKV